jgi:uncharacterized 2Fe-2S/4Fe-4S cluster protein (DUF4445 family)
LNKYFVAFYPDDAAVLVEPGTTILQAAALAGIELKSTCGAIGTCGRCAVKLKQGKIDYRNESRISLKLRDQGYVIACQARVAGNLVIEVPKDSRLVEHQVLLGKSPALLAEKKIDLTKGFAFKPLCTKLFLELKPPTREENTSDWVRVKNEIKKHGVEKDISISLADMRMLPETLRQGDWRITVTLVSLNGSTSEIVRIEPGHSDTPAYGLAIDIGTTTVVLWLVDMVTGQVVDQTGTYNKQALYGDDVISRMIFASSETNGLQKLHQAVINTINNLLEKIFSRNSACKKDLYVAVVAGNTTMEHFFLGLSPKYIRLDPYVPVITDYLPVTAAEIGLDLNENARVFCMPSVASYVGGDIVSGVLATEMAKREETVLFIDIGTNGEIVLGNKDWLMCCACSAGPAFEGGGITFGMRAMKGAIERVLIDRNTLEVFIKTIGDRQPMGICGSGLIDSIAKLRQAGLIDRTGKFNSDAETSRLRKNSEGMEFVLVWAQETECGKDIVLTEGDIKNVIRSKGAIFAGIQSLLKAVQMDLSQVDKIMIAGGFGNYLNIEDAIEIGLLPDISHDKYEFVGNTSVKGAQLSLLSREAFREIERIGKMMTYIELSSDNNFMEEFVAAMFLPHTDLNLFPSIKVMNTN